MKKTSSTTILWVKASSEELLPKLLNLKEYGINIASTPSGRLSDSQLIAANAIVVTLERDCELLTHSSCAKNSLIYPYPLLSGWTGIILN